MRWLLAGAMGLLLWRSGTAVAAVSASCRLFVTAALPGLLPYMVLSAMFVSRCGRKVSPALTTLLGWCGGSPTGARLVNLSPGMSRRAQVRTALATATMSPMFLVATCGGWLGSGRAGVTLLLSGMAGGAVTGWLATRRKRVGEGSVGEATGEDGSSGPFGRGLRPVGGPSAAGRPSADGSSSTGNGPSAGPSDGPSVGPSAGPSAALTFGAAVEQAARTLLMVCGAMAMWGMFAALAAEAFPTAALPLTTVMEVTTGVRQIASLPLPLPLRTALVAGATGFGGAAILMQNRTMYQQGRESPLLSLPRQLLWQGVHGGVSFLLALGAMLMADML